MRNTIRCIRPGDRSGGRIILNTPPRDVRRNNGRCFEVDKRRTPLRRRDGRDERRRSIISTIYCSGTPNGFASFGDFNRATSRRRFILSVGRSPRRSERKKRRDEWPDDDSNNVIRVRRITAWHVIIRRPAEGPKLERPRWLIEDTF